MTYAINCTAPKFNPRQGLFFVMSSRRDNAVVVGVHILKSDADREARARKSCVRYGYLVEGRAHAV
jgi:hypothetical protein